jgi:hypothetical protein
MHRAAWPMSQSSTSSLSVQVRRADLLKTRRAPELDGPYQHHDPRRGRGGDRWHCITDLNSFHSRRRSRFASGKLRGDAPDFRHVRQHSRRRSRFASGKLRGDAPDFSDTYGVRQLRGDAPELHCFIQGGAPDLLRGSFEETPQIYIETFKEALLIMPLCSAIIKEALLSSSRLRKGGASVQVVFEKEAHSQKGRYCAKGCVSKPL